MKNASMTKRTLRFLLPLVLGVLIGSGGFWLYSGGPGNLHIRREFHDQMLARLPQSFQVNGAQHQLRGLEITKMTQGPKGYMVEYEILWDGDTVTATSVPLEADGLGGYRCNCYDLISQKPISIYIAG